MNDAVTGIHRKVVLFINLSKFAYMLLCISISFGKNSYISFKISSDGLP